MKIKSFAPTRIGLLGGGTDVEPFASKYGGKVLSFAINLRHKATLAPRKDNHVFLHAMNDKRSFSLSKKLVYGKDSKFDLIYSIINFFKPKIRTGFTFVDEFEGVETAGLGSSGSAAVSMIAVFVKWLGVKVSKREIALLAWKMETEELGWISGKQDQLAATFGGINLLTFGKGEEKFQVFPLRLAKETVSRFGKWSLLVFTGGQRHSASLQKSLQKGMRERKKILALKKLRELVDQGVEALKREDFLTLGEILDKAWENKKKSNPAATNKRIDRLYDQGKKKGALGGKIMGAGGEGHMFFLCPPGKKGNLIKALEKEKVKKINFDFDFEGLRVKEFV